MKCIINKIDSNIKQLQLQSGERSRIYLIFLQKIERRLIFYSALNITRILIIIRQYKINSHYILLSKLTEMRVNDCYDFGKYFGNLLRNTRSNQYFVNEASTMKTNLIIITSFAYNNFKGFQDKKSLSCTEELEQYMPKIQYQDNEQSLSIINCKRYLFVNQNSKQNQLPNLSSINMLYLFRVFRNIKILFYVTHEDIVSKDKKQVNKIIQFFEQVRKKVSSGLQQGVVKNFINCIGLVVCSKNSQNTQMYKNQLSSILKNSILQNIGKQNRIYVVNQQNKSDLKKLVQQVDATGSSPFQSSPKNLSILFKHLLTPTQVQYLNKNIKTHYINNIGQIMDILQRAIDQKEIFVQDKLAMTSQLDSSIYVKMPLMQIDSYIQVYQKQKPKQMRKRDTLVIQAAYQMLIQLYKFQDELVKKQTQKNNYQTYNQQNQQFQLLNKQQIMNMSIVGNTISRIFQTNDLFKNISMFIISRYLHLFLSVFENVPNNQIRAQELKLLPVLQNLIEKMVQFFYQRLGERMAELTQSSSVLSIQPKKLMGLIFMIERLIRFLQEITKKSRQPYLSMSSNVQQNVIFSIYETLFSFSWKCHNIFIKFWSEQQKNQFYTDIYEVYRICASNKFCNLIKIPQYKQTVKIMNRVNQYFGQFYFRKREYKFAIQFFYAGKKLYKVIQCCNSWLQRMSQQKQINFDNTQKCVRNLFKLGMAQQARKWCYRFMQYDEFNSQFITLLDEFSSLSYYQQLMKQQIKKISTDDDVSLVSEDIFKVVKAQLKKQPWRHDY